MITDAVGLKAVQLGIILEVQPASKYKHRQRQLNNYR